MQKFILSLCVLIGVSVSINAANAQDLIARDRGLEDAVDAVNELLPIKMKNRLDYDIYVVVSDKVKNVKIERTGLFFNRHYQIVVPRERIFDGQLEILESAIEIFDREKIDGRSDEIGEEDYRNCQELIDNYRAIRGKNERNPRIKACYQLVEGNSNYSSDPQFLGLEGFVIKCAGPGCIKQNNVDNGRLISGDEYKDHVTAFKVNFAKFLTDKTYKCRKQSLYNYFVKEFDHVPFENYTCEPSNRVAHYMRSVLSINAKDVVIDPDRIYELQYTEAGYSEGYIGSLFGHALIKVIACRPGRPLGEECRQDTDYHYFISFGGELYRGVFDGLDHAPYSKVIANKLPAVVEFIDYNETMLMYQYVYGRKALSYKLNFNREEIKRFAKRAVEVYWRHSGFYTYQDRNCATGVWELIRTSADYDIRLYNAGLFLPMQLTELLDDVGLIDKDKIIDDSGRLKYLKDTFFKDRKMKNKDLKELALNLTLNERKELYKNHSAADVKEFELFYLVTNGNKLLEITNNEMMKMMKSDEGRKSLQNIIDYDAYVGKLNRLKTLQNGYGVPLNSELAKASEIRAMHLKALRTMTLSISKDAGKKIIANINESKAFLSTL